MKRFFPKSATPRKPFRPQRPGFTLVEVLISITLLAGLFMAAFRMFGIFSSKKVGISSARLVLQMEARRAFVDLFHQIQEGAEVLKPDPGATMPFLMLRNLQNNLIVLFLQKDKKASEAEGEDRFVLYSVTHDLDKNTLTPPRPVCRMLQGLDFTTHGFGAVLVTGCLKDKSSSFPFINMIRLKNTESEDF